MVAWVRGRLHHAGRSHKDTEMKRSLVHLVTQHNQKLGAGVWTLGISANTFPLDIYGRHRLEFVFFTFWEFVLLTSDGASKISRRGISLFFF